MSRHSALCHNSGAKHYVATRLCARDRDALSRQCGTVLRCDKEGHEPAINQAGCTRMQHTRPSAHDKVGAPRLGSQDRGILLLQIFS